MRTKPTEAAGAFAPLSYRPEIDGLRALAVLAVVVNHYNHTMVPLGYLGVDIFFVISGFVIAGAIASRTDETLGHFLAGFYARRLKRLMPALVLCIVATAVLIALFSPAPNEYLKTGFFALFGFSNLYLYARSSDYFADSTALNPFTHTWSLGVEEQFYFVFPVLLWVGARWLGLRSVPWLLAGLSLLSFLAWLWVAPQNPIGGFYLPIFRFWEIGFGAILFLYRVTARGLFAQSAQFLKLACLIGLVVIMAGVTPLTQLQAMPTVVVLTGALIVLTGPSAAPARVLRLGSVLYLGRISYSLYLWHWPVMVLFMWTIGFSEARVLLALLIALLLAHGSYTYIEHPLRLKSWAPSKLREALQGGLLAGVASLAVFGLVQLPQDALYLGAPVPLEAAGVRTLQDRFVAPSGTVWSGRPCLLMRNADLEKTIAPEACVLGAPLADAQRRVLVIGNSFSASFVQTFDGLDAFAPSLEGTSTILTSSWGAALAPNIPTDGRWSKINDHYWDVVVPDLLTYLQPGDVVLILSAMAQYSPDPQTATAPGQDPASERDAAAAALITFSETLDERGLALSVLGPLPFAVEANCTPAQGYGQWFAPAHWSCAFLSRMETQDRMSGMTQMLSALQTDGHLRVLDLFDVFCESEICDYKTADGQLLYRDVWSHPSVEAARAARPRVAQHLQDQFRELDPTDARLTP